MALQTLSPVLVVPTEAERKLQQAIVLSGVVKQWAEEARLSGVPLSWLEVGFVAIIEEIARDVLLLNDDQVNSILAAGDNIDG